MKSLFLTSCLRPGGEAATQTSSPPLRSSACLSFTANQWIRGTCFPLPFFHVAIYTLLHFLPAVDTDSRPFSLLVLNLLKKNNRSPSKLSGVSRVLVFGCDHGKSRPTPGRDSRSPLMPAVSVCVFTTVNHGRSSEERGRTRARVSWLCCPG